MNASIFIQLRQKIVVAQRFQVSWFSWIDGTAMPPVNRAGGAGSSTHNFAIIGQWFAGMRAA